MLMTSLLNLLAFVAIAAVDIGLVFFIRKYYKKSRDIASANRQQASAYSKNIIIGITSGVIVLVLDRVINLFIQHLPSLDTTNILAFITSVAGAILLGVFVAAFILAAVIYTNYIGLGAVVGRR